MAEPTPVNILRGHKAQIHAAAFVRSNDRLATGDADGFVMLWDLAIMRPRAVWRAHENAILAIKGWGNDKIITHGRDHRLVVWQLRLEDEENLKTTSPLDHSGDALPQPWMLHVLEVNTMNFCAFAACGNMARANATALTAEESSILVAVPNTLLAESIDIFELPSQTRGHTVKPGGKHGMAMALAITHKDKQLVLIAGFEDGVCLVFVLDESSREWATTYRSQAHSQPVLSLDIHPQGEYFITSSADSLIAKHPIPTTLQITIPEDTATLPAARTEPPVDEARPIPKATTGIGALFAGEPASDKSVSINKKFSTRPWEDPLKVVNTKHSGQQSLVVRSDGLICATAGWDSKIRVYATKSLKELAVLKWHQVGVYATAFSLIEAANDKGSAPEQPATSSPKVEGAAQAQENISASLMPRSTEVQSRQTVKDRRVQQAKHTHWVAAGAKDGKLSLWKIY